MNLKETWGTQVSRWVARHVLRHDKGITVCAMVHDRSRYVPWEIVRRLIDAWCLVVTGDAHHCEESHRKEMLRYCIDCNIKSQVNHASELAQTTKETRIV